MAGEYDKSDINSIVKYAERAKNTRISELFDTEIVVNSKDKGLVGNLIQEHYFGIPRNSSTKPDFEAAGIELKSFGYWDDGKIQKADQRLALSKIDFMEFQEDVPFEKSHLYKKCRIMLFFVYLLKLNQNRIDSEVQHIRLYKFDRLVQNDFEQIKKDYQAITKKIREGNASKLSEGDTEFLGAARTGDKNSVLEEAPNSDKALPRRFALKQSYMSYLVREYIVPQKGFDEKIHRQKSKYQIRITRGKTFEEWLDKIDAKYVGKTAKKISRLKSIKGITGTLNPSQKDSLSKIGRAMLGIKSNNDDYLKKTNTVVKSVRISKSGCIEENWSFPTFCVEDIQNQEWEESEVFMYLSENRILMQIFVENQEGYVYCGHLFLKFTPEELDKYVKNTWEDFKKKAIDGLQFEIIKNGKKIKVRSNVNKKTEGQIGLIKNHAGGVTYNIDINHLSRVDERVAGIVAASTVNGRFIWKPENKNIYGCRLLNGDLITKQSFWLNNDFLLEYIRENRPDILTKEEEG